MGSTEFHGRQRKVRGWSRVPIPSTHREYRGQAERRQTTGHLLGHTGNRPIALLWLILVVALAGEQAAGVNALALRPDGLGITRTTDALPPAAYLPFVTVTRADTCQPIPGVSYHTLTVIPPPTDRPAEAHADLNLALRGYAPTNAYRGLVNYAGGADANAPQLPGLFADHRTAAITAVYQVYDWDWACNCRGSPLTEWEVTLADLATTPGETIHVPNSGYHIGDGYSVLVLYASNQRITLKFTREDNVVRGYTIHLENVCVEPTLLALYQTWNTAGRGELPALQGGQALGRARGGHIGVAIRDYGSFMDPRSRKDWWQ